MTIINFELAETTRQYQIHINEFDLLDKTLSKYSQIALITHRALWDIYQDKFHKYIDKYQFHIIFIDSGEINKSWNNTEYILQELIQLNLDRHSCLIGFGGGVVGDITGFCASIFQRGIHCIQMPTSLLAMVDSSVGGKTAVNLANTGKNLIGTFHQPNTVSISIDFLKSLPDVEYYNGLAEVIKYALLINDQGAFFRWLTDNHAQIIERNPEALYYLIHTSVQCKKNIVLLDEKEQSGMRALLNLGHTFGHALEALSKYALPHGQAVAIGIKLATQLSYKLQYINSTVYQDILNILTLYNMNYMANTYDIGDIYNQMKFDKKNKNNQINLILPSGNLSNCQLYKNIKQDDIMEILKTLS